MAIVDPFDTETPSIVDPFSGAPESQAGFADSFITELKAIGNQYASAADDPAGALDGIVQAGEAFMAGDVDFGRAMGVMMDDVVENPVGAAGTFAAQLFNPINLVPLGPAAAAGRAALKVGKLGATAAGGAVGAATGAVTGLADEGLRARSENRELTPEEATNAVAVNAALSGPLSLVPAHITAGRTINRAINDKVRVYGDTLDTFEGERTLHQEKLDGVATGAGTTIKWGKVTKEEYQPIDGEALPTAYFDHETNTAHVDYDKLMAEFDAKVWENPTVEGVDPLKGFDTAGEYAEFITRHEVNHSGFLQEAGESLAAYENRINDLTSMEMERGTHASQDLELARQGVMDAEAKAPDEYRATLARMPHGDKIEMFRRNVEAEFGGILPPAANVALKRLGKHMVEQAVKYVPEPIVKAGKTTASVAQKLVGKSSSRIEDIAKRGSEAARSLHTAIAGSSTGRFVNSIQHTIDRMAGPPKTAIRSVLRVLPRTSWASNKLNSADDVRLRRQLNGTDKLVDSDAREIRKQLQLTWRRARKMGVEMRRVKDYLTRQYDIEYLLTDDGYKGLIDLLVEHGWDERHARGAVDNIINSNGLIDSSGKGKTKLKFDADGNLITDDLGAVTDLSTTKSRSIDLPDTLLAPYLRKGGSLDALLNDYMDGMARHAVYVKEFGKSNEFLNLQVRQIQRDLKKIGKTLSQAELDDIYNLTDALRFQQKPLDLQGESTTAAVDRVINKANKVFIPAIHLITLPLATIASIAEIALPLARVANRPSAYYHGIKAAAGHARQSFKAAFKNVPEHDATRAISELNIGFNAGFKRLMDSLMHHESRTGAAISSASFKVNLLDAWTRFAMVASNETAKSMIVGHLKDLAMNKGDKKAYIKDLAQLRVDVDKGIQWYKDGADVEAPFYREQIVGGGLNFVQQTVMMPNPAQLPLWHTNPRFRLIAQLKSFPTMFGNTVLTAWGKQLMSGSGKERAALAGTVAASVMIGIMANESTDYIRYGQKGNPRRTDISAEETMLEGLDRSGVLGPTVMLRDMARSPQFGRSWLTVLAGPTASFIEGGFKAAMNEDKLKAMSKFIPHLLPGLNINKGIRKSLEESIQSLGD